MSIQLLDKTRKINRLLNDKHSSKVAFADICFVLGQMLLANAYIISSKGKLLGTYVNDDGMIPSFQSKRGSYIETMLNERFLNVLSTKENVNLETLGFSKEERQGVEALITPISIGGERLGTLFLCRCQKAFSRISAPPPAPAHRHSAAQQASPCSGCPPASDTPPGALPAPSFCF